MIEPKTAVSKFDGFKKH